MYRRLTVVEPNLSGLRVGKLLDDLSAANADYLITSPAFDDAGIAVGPLVAVIRPMFAEPVRQVLEQFLPAPPSFSVKQVTDMDRCEVIEFTVDDAEPSLTIDSAETTVNYAGTWLLRSIMRHARQALGMPKVVCLCGSSRFRYAFAEARWQLGLQGNIVLTINESPAGDIQLWGELPDTPLAGIKADFDALHLRKIELADRVHVLNVGGYIGPSTQREIQHAQSLGIPVVYLEPPAVTAAAHDGAPDATSAATP